MPRNKKPRAVFEAPRFVRFLPAGRELPSEEAVIMTVEEYEAVRLIDREGLTQEECAERMEIARTTAQKIYCDARKKISLMLTEGKPLLIEGGDYRICGGAGRRGRGRGCGRRRRGNRFADAGEYTDEHTTEENAP